MRVVAFVLLSSSIAAAAPLAQLDATLDGKPAHVAVDGGALVVDGQPVVQLGPAITAAAIEARDLVDGGPTIVVTITTAHGQEAVGLQKRGTWTQLFRVPVGGVGEDADYGIAISLLSNGINRYQTRPTLHRCDGKPALFFAEGWNKTKFSRQGRIDPEIDPGIPAIAAQPEPSPAPAPLLYHATIASREADASDITALGVPTMLEDGDSSTAWSDAKAKGQFFTFAARSSAKASELRFVAATHGAAPTQIAIVGRDRAFQIDLPVGKPGAAYVATLPEPIEGCVTAVIESDGPAAIGELEVFAEGERAAGGERVLAALIASGSDGAKVAGQALAHRGAAAVTALADVLAGAKDAAARARVVMALIATKDPSAGPVLAKAARELRLRDADLAAVLRALGQLGQLPELAALVATDDLEVPARVLAVQAIAAVPGDHATLLVPLAGTGAATLRRAVIEALSGVPVAELAAAAKTADHPAASGDLWRAITRRGHAVPAEHAAALAALVDELPTATDFERRYRILDGLATLGDAAVLAQVASTLEQLPPGADRAALGQVVAHALASAPRADALPLIVELARDSDPGVRLAALSALVGDAWQVGETVGVLESTLASDTWPELRRRAAEVLGERCALSGPARALTASLGRDPELSVRDGALAALVECKAPGVEGLLATVWDDNKLPLALRQRAIDLAAALGEPALGTKLVGKLASWRGAALESSDALVLAQSAAYAIGKLAPPGAADALQAALEDGAYPEIVAAAASGLGLLGLQCPTQARAKLRVLARSDERQIALAAGRAAVQCGVRNNH